MGVKELKYGERCDLHPDVKPHYTGDECSDWYECAECRKIDTREFYEFIADTSAKVKLWPKWKGGDGLGVTCPCCKGNSDVTPEYAEKVKKLLEGLNESPFLPVDKVNISEEGKVSFKKSD
jgi:hypothetical protein